MVSTRVRSDDVGSLSRLRSRHSGTVVFVVGPTPGYLVPGIEVLHAPDAAEAARRWNAVVGR